jgi:hypothetical protein
MRLINRSVTLSLCFMLAALPCSASYRPILDENDTYERAGAKKADKDIDSCISKADKHLAKHSSTRTKKAVGRSAGLGASMGALGGLLSGSPTGAVKGSVRGAASGAGSTAIVEGSRDGLTPDQMKQNYVRNCLEKQGYKILGWE